MRWSGAIVLVLASFWAFVTLLPWSAGPCGEDYGTEAYSPDGRSLAKVFVRSCGATTGWVTHVNLRSKWSYFNPEWTGTIKDGEVFANDCWSKVSPVWKDNWNLEIQYERCAVRESDRGQAFMKQSFWKGVNITYRELPNDHEAVH